MPTRTGDPTPNGCHPHDCSLREAVITANHHPGRDTVVLRKKGPYKLQIPPSGPDDETTGDLDITDPIAILHHGGGKAVIDAGGIDRAIHVVTPTSGRYSKLSRIALRGGDAPSWGGAILLGSGLLGLTKSVVSHNSATFDGGGIYATAGELTLDHTTVSDNEAAGGGGGVLTVVETDVRESRIVGNQAGTEGGGIEALSGSLKVSSSEVTGNRAAAGAGGIATYMKAKITKSAIAGNRAGTGVGGGIFNRAGSLKLTSSTVSRNKTMNDGGGVQVYGDATLVNDTITENDSGGYGGGVEVDGDSATLNAVTVARNSAATGGGIEGTGTNGFHVGNSLIALNSSSGLGPDCRPNPALTSDGHNLIGDATDCGLSFGLATHDLTNVDPRIGKLADNGGPTKTIALRGGSKAIGRAGSSAPGRDQRGVKRDKHPDIGAFERG